MIRQFFLLFLTFISLLSGDEILFCLSSKAEAVDLEKLMNYCLDEGHDVHILAFGTAKEHLQPSFNLISLPSKLNDLGKNGPFVNDSKHVEELLSFFPSSDLFICGLSSALQIDIINKLPRRKTIGFIDGFNTFETHPFINKLNKEKIDVLFVPWKGMLTSWQSHFEIPIIAVGKVDLEEKIERNPQKNKLFILYTGGYGPEYEKDFTLFVKSMQFWQKQTNKDHEIVITLHPAIHVDGIIEKRTLEKWPLKHAKIIDKTIPTTKLMKKAHILITAYSTTAIKAALNKLPAMHVSYTFKNTLTESKMLPCVRTRRQFLEQFNTLIDKKSESNFSLEKDATKKMYEHMKPFLKVPTLYESSDSMNQF